MIRSFKKNVALIMSVALASCFLPGCSAPEKETQIVLTSPFEEDEVFRIDESSCRLAEVRVYMKQVKDQYEGLFGSEIWTKDLGDVTLGEELKDTILARLAQLKVMSLLAADHGIELTQEETDEAQRMAGEYLDSLSDNELEKSGADQEIISNMYSEYMLAEKVYNKLTGDVNPEISDDEARTIKVKHILIKTYFADVSGNRVELGTKAKKRAKKKLENIRQEIMDGADFDELAQKYNEDDKTAYSFMKGDMPEAFEDAAFELDTDEVSQVVETPYGYHLIKCVSTFDRDETDQNKEKIVRERKNEAFNEIYGEFVRTVHSNLNEELWNSIEF